MAKRKERNMSGQFLAIYEDQIVGPFTGREKAIAEVKKIMPDPTEKSADIYHRVCEVKVKNLEVKDETEQDVSSVAEKSVQDDEVPFAL